MILILPKDIIIMYCINLLLYRHMELPPVQNQHKSETTSTEWESTLNDTGTLK